MEETIRFGSQTYGYMLLILVIVFALFLSVVVCLWLIRFFLPSKHVLRKRSRLLLFLLLTWPLVVVTFGIWGGYQIGYCHFYLLRISAEQKLAIRYLWPKGEISISADKIISIAVVRKGPGRKVSDVLVIETKNGKKYVSTAPVPDQEVLPSRIWEAMGVNAPKKAGQLEL